LEEGLTPSATSPWHRWDVDGWEIVREESAGSSVAVWLEEPETHLKWLQKDTVVPSHGFEQGEDWSEVVSTQIGLALGVPCATTRLCMRSGHRGSLSLNVTPDKYNLWDGMVVLESCAEVTDYFPHVEGQPGLDPARPNVKRPGHSVENIQRALDGVLAPPGFVGPDELDAFDVFCGYLLFDALVANRDRHEQNWSVLVPSLGSEPSRLAPTYDHASSLGYNMLDDRRTARLRDPNGVRIFAEKGTAWRIEHSGQPPTLVAVASDALSRCSDTAADFWRQRIRQLDVSPIAHDLEAGVIPAMSVEASKFALSLIDRNLERLNDAI
jgi:hypothetical protein